MHFAPFLTQFLWFCKQICFQDRKPQSKLWKQDWIFWKREVELAKKEGYKIDGISTYITSSESVGGTVNVLVAMSKGWNIFPLVRRIHYSTRIKLSLFINILNVEVERHYKTSMVKLNIWACKLNMIENKEYWYLMRII